MTPCGLNRTDCLSRRLVCSNCLAIHAALDWATVRACLNDTPKGTATRTPLKGLTVKLILLARRLRSSSTGPTGSMVTVFDCGSPDLAFVICFLTLQA
jgi:hypothetical protein